MGKLKDYYWQTFEDPDYDEQGQVEDEVEEGELVPNE